MTLEKLLEKLWIQYTQLNPQARIIHKLLEERGEKVLNDHVAFRTYNHPNLGIESLAKEFRKNDYVEKGEYHFEEKKLYAIHLEHPDLTKPKIFISELLTEKFPKNIQSIINSLCEKVPRTQIDSADFCISGRPWNIDYKTYQELLAVSEYAGWMSAFGFCA